MSRSALKGIQAAAGAAAGSPVYVDDVFSTYLYEGNATDRNIVNGIDLSGEGGLVWIKERTRSSTTHDLYDTARGAGYWMTTTGSYGQTQQPAGKGLTAFNNNGFSLGALSSNGTENSNGQDIASWTFRKQEKFFDIVTYTGNGTAGRTISHNLGSVPGMMIVKSTSNTESWQVYHRKLDASAPEDKYLRLNSTGNVGDSSFRWNDTAPTATEFTVGGANEVNGNGMTYVAYLFAHNEQEFGENSDEAIIKCGSFTGNTASVDLGFEPQWVMFKRIDSSIGGDWHIYDIMRGFHAPDEDDALFYANNTNAESLASRRINLTSTGFDQTTNLYSGATYIYMAIARPHKPASEFAATDLYKSLIYTGDGSSTKALDFGFSPDLMIGRDRASSGTLFINRLAGVTQILTSHTSNAENTNTDYVASFDQLGVTVKSNFIGGSANNKLQHGFRRVKGFFDVATYTGDGTNGRTVSHNLGVTPEIVIVKSRSAVGTFYVYHSATGATKGTYLNATSATATSVGFWNNTAPTSSVFSTHSAFTNPSSVTHIAYLFATVAGISKVGSYTGTGSDLNVDCGFSAGARFVLIKRTDSTGDWYVYDSVRGIVAGDDPYVFLNATAGEVTNTDYIDPLSSGFTVTSSAPAELNASAGTYIFLAIA